MAFVYSWRVFQSKTEESMPQKSHHLQIVVILIQRAYPEIKCALKTCKEFLNSR